MLRLCIVVFFFVHFDSHACTIPRGGAEFDELISVQRVSGNEFSMSAPLRAFDLEYGAQIVVTYYPKDSEHRIGEYWKDIYYKQEGENYIATFNLNKIEDHIPYVLVYWLPRVSGLCGAYGRSEDISLE